jgi:hypothetical protein
MITASKPHTNVITIPEEDAMSQNDRIAALELRHADLDKKLTALSSATNPDETDLHALKRQKLAIKDEIAALQRHAP